MLQIVLGPSPFWIIWNPEGPHAPRVRFNAEEAASKEAKRLAKQNPGQEFFVLQMVGEAKAPAVPEPVYTKAAPQLPDQFNGLKNQTRQKGMNDQWFSPNGPPPIPFPTYRYEDY